MTLYKKLVAISQSDLDQLMVTYFNMEYIPPCTLIIVKDKNTWQSLFERYPFGEWGAGVTFVGKNLIYIQGQLESVHEIKSTLIHEWIHYVISYRYKKWTLPLWLEEGLAQYLSGQKLPLQDQVYFSNYIVINKLLPFPEISRISLMNEKKAKLAYVESYLAVYHMDQIMGQGTLEKLIGKNPIGFESFNDYFYSICGISPEGYESKFFTFIKEKYKFLFILNLENLVFLLILFLLFGSYFVIKRRNKKLIAQMSDEDLPEL
ncbi:MAG: hypothetical protein Kow00108_16520 [Calditrichia bacterium]